MRLFWGPDGFHSSHSAAGEVLNSINPSHPLIVGQVSCNGLLKTDFLSCLLWWCSSSLWRSAHRFLFLTRIQEELFKYLIMFVKGPKLKYIQYTWYQTEESSKQEDVVEKLQINHRCSSSPGHQLRYTCDYIEVIGKTPNFSLQE